MVLRMDTFSEVIIKKSNDSVVDTLASMVLSHNDVPDLEDGGKTGLLSVFNVGF